jgi:ABC-type polar amino acid transport system ATPase subunit
MRAGRLMAPAPTAGTDTAPDPDPDPAAAPHVVRIRDLRKSFGDHVVLDGVDLDVRRGEVVSILGRSGGGKSTLLRCINLLERPTSGRIDVAGYRAFDDGVRVRRQELVALRRKVGMVFQSFHVFPHLSAAENVVLPLVHGAGVDERAAVRRAVETLALVGLSHKALAAPETMSGGEQQRVAIARALALRPEALLFDEPTSALDPESTREVLDVIRKLSGEGMTMVVVTHELAFAREVSDTVVFVDKGLIVEQGKPRQVIDAPRQARTRAFMAGMVGSADGGAPADTGVGGTAGGDDGTAGGSGDGGAR